MMQQPIHIEKAQVHNLKSVTLDIPRNRLVVLTGPSGSGKSSLAFDTIYAEGRRQYIESLSVYARQFLHQLERPDVESIKGLQPTISIDQKNSANNPRSTVATMTEVYDYLRVLYARAGLAHCWNCGRAIRQQSPERIHEEMLSLPEGCRLMLLAPLVQGRRGQHSEVFRKIIKAGFVRARVDGVIVDVEAPPELDQNKQHVVEVVIDRLVMREGIASRLSESLKLAVKFGEGTVIASYEMERVTNPDGTTRSVWKDLLYSTHYACAKCKINYAELEPRTFSFNSPYGACPDCQGMGEIEEERCPACDGSRLRPEARSVTIAKQHIHDVCAMTVEKSLEFFKSLAFPDELRQVTTPIIEQIVLRLDFLNRVGLDYLTLDRSSDSLSGGELQRVRLASGLGTGLVGVCYVLDEPSIGLHPRDNRRLIDAMRNLQRRGNTVLVVEHDEAIMREADWLIDFGPGAGKFGGMIMAQGTPDDVERNGNSLTGQYLSGALSIPVPAQRRKPVKSRMLTLEGCTLHNLKDVTVSFPLGTLITVTGVSGSGKSSLLDETLVPALIQRLYGTHQKPGPHKSIKGANKIDKLIRIDQSPIGRSPRSNPATYTGVFDEIRKVFAQTRDAKRRGYKSGRFSFNVAGGRCETCQGQGLRKIEMHFLPDMYAVCPDCEGKRFNRQTLDIRYKEKSIADVLDMPVVEAAVFFENFPTIARVLDSLNRVGLGYLTLGQSSTTLSGGEAQRIKLATELSRVETGNTLYVFDEPTSGLHLHDIRQLLGVLSELVDLGNTVIVIEHNLDVIKTADWIIDLGPEGGERGGQLLATGTPEQIAALDDNATGQYLKKMLPSSQNVAER